MTVAATTPASATKHNDELGHFRMPQWRLRGTHFFRRLNSAHLAEDPRMRFLINHGVNATENLLQELARQEKIRRLQNINLELTREDEPTYEGNAGQKKFDKKHDSHSADTLKSFSAINTSPTGYTTNGKLVYFHTNKPETYLVQMTYGIFTLHPDALNVLLSVLEPQAKKAAWNSASEFLQKLSHVLLQRGKDGLCVFDCGLFDAIEKRYQRSIIVGDEFVDGKMMSSRYEKGLLPSTTALFMTCSAIASWLNACAPASSTTVLIIAPTHAQVSAYLACTAQYCSGVLEDLSEQGIQIIQWYDQLLQETERRKFRFIFGNEQLKNTSYDTFKLPRPQVRLLSMFEKLIHLRDHQILAHSTDKIPASSSLDGMTILPSFRTIRLMNVTLRTKDSDVDEPCLLETFRPYIAIKNIQGEVLYSSMSRGVHSTPWGQSNGCTFTVEQDMHLCDLVLCLYDLQRRGEKHLLVESRLHVYQMERLFSSQDEIQLLRLHRCKGDFDSISSTKKIPRDLTIQLRFRLQPVLHFGPSDTPCLSEYSLDDLYESNLSSHELQFEKDVDNLCEIFPGIDRTTLARYRSHVRRTKKPMISAIDQVRGYIYHAKLGDGVVQMSILEKHQKEAQDLSSSEQEICVVCFEEIECRNRQELTCGHGFHQSCIGIWLQTKETCPICVAHV